MSERNIIFRNPVPNYIPRSSEIHRVIFEDGEEAYYTPPGGANNHSHKINVISTELEALVSNWIAQLRCMVKQLDGDDYIGFGQNFETVLKAFDREMDEALNAVYQNIGGIKIHQVGINVATWREGRVVGVEFEPKL